LARKFNIGRQDEQLLNEEWHGLYSSLKYLNYDRYKNIEDVSLTGTKELEVEVEDFEKTNELLNILGYMPKAFQENKRIRYLLEGTEVDIDFWPLIPAYLEIEGSSKEEVEKIENMLEVNKEKITYLNCSDIYKNIYGIDSSKIKEIKF
jgi:adenylate cyclase class 2